MTNIFYTYLYLPFICFKFKNLCFPNIYGNQNVFSLTMSNISLGKNQKVHFGRKQIRPNTLLQCDKNFRLDFWEEDRLI